MPFSSIYRLLLTPVRSLDVQVFHSGTTFKNGKVVTAGGRVMAVTGTASTLAGAQALAYEGVKCVHFDGMTYRKDIGYRFVPFVPPLSSGSLCPPPAPFSPTLLPPPLAPSPTPQQESRSTPGTTSSTSSSLSSRRPSASDPTRSSVASVDCSTSRRLDSRTLSSSLEPMESEPSSRSRRRTASTIRSVSPLIPLGRGSES